MTLSMTGYATATGHADDWSWTWQVRSVNGRGLDVKCRVPEWIDGLEAEVRKRIQGVVSRGSVNVQLRLTRAELEGSPIDGAALASVLARVRAVEAAAEASGRPLAPCRAVDILSLLQRVGPSEETTDPAALRAALLDSLDGEVLPAFGEARRAEGRALSVVLGRLVDEIADLVVAARSAAAARDAGVPEALRAAVARLAREVEPARLAQEVALLAVRSDLTEEIDRLGAHVDAARGLLADTAPKGRRLDFLAQEFNREANTLCAKSQDTDLTAVGLDLKLAIDRLREQVQNVE